MPSEHGRKASTTASDSLSRVLQAKDSVQESGMTATKKGFEFLNDEEEVKEWEGL